MRKKFLLTVAFSTMLILSGCDSSDYQKAEKLMENGSYSEAVSIFENLGDYKDSSQKILEARYGSAGLLMANGDYAEAARIYSELGDYSDSPQKLSEAKYGSAEQLMANGDYDGAVKIYDELEDYSDSPQKVLEARFFSAEKLAEIGDYSAALDIYDSLGDYGADGKSVFEAKYSIAEKFMENKDYISAAKIFESLGDYSQSKQRLAAARTGIGDELIKKGDYSGAKTFFIKTGNTNKIKECDYNIAKTLYGEGKYIEAKKSFEKLGDYSDSSEQAENAAWDYLMDHYKDGYSSSYKIDISGGNEILNVKANDEMDGLLLTVNMESTSVDSHAAVITSTLYKGNTVMAIEVNDRTENNTTISKAILTKENYPRAGSVSWFVAEDGYLTKFEQMLSEVQESSKEYVNYEISKSNKALERKISKNIADLRAKLDKRAELYDDILIACLCEHFAYECPDITMADLGFINY